MKRVLTGAAIVFATALVATVRVASRFLDMMDRAEAEIRG